MTQHWLPERFPPSVDVIKTITFYLNPGFELMALSSALDVLRHANAAAGHDIFRWRLVSKTGDTVVASCGLEVAAHSDLRQERQRLTDPGRPIMAIICGDERLSGGGDKALNAWLRECRQRKIGLGAFEKGVFALASAGLLNDRQCSIHWELQPAFDERFMRVQTVTTVYEIDDNIWTCPGGTAVFDMMVALVQQNCGEIIATRICEFTTAGRVREGKERQRLPLLRKLGPVNPTIISLIELMQNNLSNPLPMDKLAAAVNLSRRQVERLFRQELGQSPCRYRRELRLERAKLLLTQSALSVVEVAISCGFVSASHFSKTFRDANRIAPHEARKLVAV